MHAPVLLLVDSSSAARRLAALLHDVPVQTLRGPAPRVGPETALLVPAADMAAARRLLLSLHASGHRGPLALYADRPDIEALDSLTTGRPTVVWDTAELSSHELLDAVHALAPAQARNKHLGRLGGDLPRQMAQLAGVGSWWADSDFGTAEWSSEMRVLVGISPEAETPTLDNFLARVHVDDRAALLRSLHLACHGTSSAADFRYLRPDGRTVHLHSASSLDGGFDGTPRLLTVVQDHSELERLRKALSEQEARAALVLASVSDGYLFHQLGVILEVNGAVSTITGYPREEVLGSCPPPFYPSGSAPDAWFQAVTSDDGAPVDLLLRHRDGSPILVTITSRPARSVAGDVSGFVTTMRDITAERAHLRRLEDRANRDSLTGLLNRRAFNDLLLECHERHAAQPSALVLLDIDHFKQVNDIHGHPAGDAALREVSSRLIAGARDDDRIARVGGEEFAWLMPGTDSDAATAAAMRALAAISHTAMPHGSRVTMSAGVAVTHGSGSPDELLAAADRALYAAKRLGRNRVETCPPPPGKPHRHASHE